MINIIIIKNGGTFNVHYQEDLAGTLKCKDTFNDHYKAILPGNSKVQGHI